MFGNSTHRRSTVLSQPLYPLSRIPVPCMNEAFPLPPISLPPPVAYVRPRSGTALEDPEFHAEGDSFSPSPPVDGLFFRRHHRRPPVTVHAENVPLASLARLDRSFVGAPPLRLAAFRRLLDSSKPWATASRSREFGAVCGEGDGGGGGGSGSNGRGGGGGGGLLFEAPRGQAAIREGVAAEEADVSGAWRGGEQEEEEEGSSRSGGVGSLDDFRDRELAQAGCLIEVRKCMQTVL